MEASLRWSMQASSSVTSNPGRMAPVSGPAIRCRSRQQHTGRRLPTLSVTAADSGGTGDTFQVEPSAGIAPLEPPPSPQDLTAAAHDATAFAALLSRLASPGGGCTEAHVVAAWAAQRRSAALQASGAGDGQAQALQALVALEELTWRQVVALSPDQLGYVFRCYVQAGGASKPLLGALQDAACSWGSRDFSAAGLAELAWALASCSTPVPEACRRLLRSALQESAAPRDELEKPLAEQQQLTEQQLTEQQHSEQQPGDQQQAHQGPSEQRVQAVERADCAAQQDGQEQAGAAEPAPQQQQQQQQHTLAPPRRDWEEWLRGTPPSRVTLLLWAAARLGCHPCKRCMKAAAAVLQRGKLSTLSNKSLVALLWALAKLQARSPRPLLRAVSGELANRMEACLGHAGAQESASTAAAAAPPTDTDGSEGISWGSGASSDGDSDATLHIPGSDVISSSSSSKNSSSEATLMQPDAPAAEQPGAGAFQASQLCTAVWACGQLRHADTRMLAAATALLHSHVHEMGSADTARALWGLGHLGYCPTPLLDAVAARLQQPGALRRFTTRQLAMATFAFASLDFFPGQACVDAVADACLAARSSFDPRALSHVLWNMARLGLVDEPFYQAFVPVIVPNIRQYGPAELADIARVYSRFGLNPESSAAGAEGGGEGAGAPTTLFDALAAQTVARIQGADIQDVLRIMTAFHQMGLQPVELLSAVEGWADQRLRRLTPQSLSLALWSFARMGSGSPKLLETAAACAERQLDHFTPQQLAKVAWALAKLAWPAPRVLRHAGGQLAQRGAAFGDKDASNVLWALASGGEALSPDQLDCIAASLQPRLKGFGPQSLANIAWAYATLRHAPPAPFLRLLGDAAERQLRACEPQGVSLLVWSLASLGCRHNRLFSSIAALCCERPGLLRQFEGQHLSNMLWGFCRAGFQPDPGFLELVAEEAGLRVCDMKPQELFNVAWAFAQVSEDQPHSLFDAIAREAAPRAFAFSPQELSGTLWALAKCRHSGGGMPPLLEAVDHALATREAEFEDRHLAIAVWSFGQVGHVPQPAALAAALEGARRRVPAASSRTLTTLVAGLGDVELVRQRLAAAAATAAATGGQGAVALAGGEAERGAEGTWAAGGVTAAAPLAADRSAAAAAAAPCLVPPELVDVLAERAVQLLPQLRPFEVASLLRGFAALGSGNAAACLLRTPDAAAAAALLDAARRARPPSLIDMLWAMATWQCYPEEPLAVLAGRLRKVHPDYRFSQPTLALLGQALASMDPQRRKQLRLRGGLVVAARAAAHVASLPAGSHGSRGESNNGDLAPAVRSGQQQRKHIGGQSEVAVVADEGSPPACSNMNEDPLMWSMDELPGRA